MIIRKKQTIKRDVIKYFRILEIRIKNTTKDNQPPFSYENCAISVTCEVLNNRFLNKYESLNLIMIKLIKLADYYKKI